MVSCHGRVYEYKLTWYLPSWKPFLHRSCSAPMMQHSEFWLWLAFEGFFSCFSSFQVQLYSYGVFLHLIQYVYMFRAQGGLPRATQFDIFRVVSIKWSFIHLTLLNPYEVHYARHRAWDKHESKLKCLFPTTFESRADNTRAVGLVPGVGVCKREEEPRKLSHWLMGKLGKALHV